jgi:predicted AAA+ superfamily ATPase
MPQRIDFPNLDKAKIYLLDLFDSITVKDIINRYKIANASLFKRIVEYLVTNPSQTFSPTKMLSEFEKENIPVSTKTVYETLSYVESSLIMSKISSYDIRGKKILSRKDKYYLTDLGIGQIVNSNKKLQLGSYLENLVYNELIYRGYTVSIGNNNGKEVDFIATRFEEKIYIQVAYILTDETVVDREFGAYDGIADYYPKYVLTTDKFNFSQNGIIHKNIIDWLLDTKYYF